MLLLLLFDHSNFHASAQQVVVCRKAIETRSVLKSHEDRHEARRRSLGARIRTSIPFLGVDTNACSVERLQIPRRVI